MKARYSSRCQKCKGWIYPGQRIRMGYGWTAHAECARDVQTSTKKPDERLAWLPSSQLQRDPAPGERNVSQLIDRPQTGANEQPWPVNWLRFLLLLYFTRAREEQQERFLLRNKISTYISPARARSSAFSTGPIWVPVDGEPPRARGAGWNPLLN